MKVTFVYPPYVADQYRVFWRCKNVARSITQTGLHQAHLLELDSFIKNGPLAYDICKASDVIVIEKYLHEPVLQAVQRWKAYDKKVFIDFDETVHLLNPELEQVKTTKGESFGNKLLDDEDLRHFPLKDQYKWGLRLMDGVFVSSMRLTRGWETSTPIFEIPDYIDVDQYLTIQNPLRKGIWIGLGGGEISYETFAESGLFAALHDICTLRKDVHILICGAQYRIAEELVIPEDQRTIISWISAEDWPFYAAKLDIGIAPVVLDEDMPRNWQRVLEYMILKIPWIASNRLLYRCLKQYGTFVDNKADAWRGAILNVINHIEQYRIEASREAYFFALGYDIDENISKILSIYSSVLH